MLLVIANGGTIYDPYFALAGISAVGLFLIPVATVISYLKDRRLISVVGVISWIAALPATGLTLPLVGHYELQSYAMATAGLLVVLFSAVRLAPPWSWWAQRRYGRKKMERAVGEHERP